MEFALSEIDKAYIAGFFDGDGHVSITKAKASPPRWKNPRYHLLAVITHSNEELVDFVNSSFGYLAIKKGPYPSFIPHGKPLFQIRFEGRKCQAFIQALNPYLHLKKEQATVALEYSLLPFRTHPGRGLTQEQLGERERLFQKMIQLNKKESFVGDLSERLKISEINKAYFAGFFDAEGHITIGKRPANPPRWKNPAFNLIAVITNTNEEILDFTNSKFGNIGHKHGPYKQMKFGRKPLFHLRFMGDACRIFVVTIGPYLRLKKEQAKLALDYPSSQSRKGRRLTPRELDTREEFYQKMKKLNERGSSAHELPEYKT